MGVATRHRTTRSELDICSGCPALKVSATQGLEAEGGAGGGDLFILLWGCG